VLKIKRLDSDGAIFPNIIKVMVRHFFIVLFKG